MLQRVARHRSAALAALVALVVAACGSQTASPASAASAPTTPAAVDGAVAALVSGPGGPPGAIALVDRAGTVVVHTAGTGEVGADAPITPTDHLRLASVSKAFSGAVALSLVATGVLHLDDTVGRWLPGLTTTWSQVTLAELLQHTSGIPDFSQTPEFRDAVKASLLVPPPPVELLTPVVHEPTTFPPGSAYAYSNSDNEVVALMVEAATGHTYAEELASQVTGPLGLADTTLPTDAALPSPYAHGYDLTPGSPPEDVSSLFAAGWSWASGGVVSTPTDADRFVRAYVRGATTTPSVRAAQFRFRPGSSEPPGPGTNAAGLAVFRYQTRCGTVYGHTGNTAGYTQFIGASADGRSSVVVSVNAQITPKTDEAAFARLQQLETLAVCSALGR